MRRTKPRYLAETSMILAIMILFPGLRNHVLAIGFHRSHPVMDLDALLAIDPLVGKLRAIELLTGRPLAGAWRRGPGRCGRYHLGGGRLEAALGIDHERGARNDAVARRHP